jgi:hypothetical protein
MGARASGPLIVFRTARVLARLMIMSARDARGPEDEDHERAGGPRSLDQRAAPDDFIVSISAAV